MEEVNLYWQLYNAYKATAEQHEFMQLFMYDLKLIPAYQDLQKNYTEEHAEIFKRGMKIVFDKLGIKIPEKQEE
jgi:hypothetical protein